MTQQCFKRFEFFLSVCRIAIVMNESFGFVNVTNSFNDTSSVTNNDNATSTASNNTTVGNSGPVFYFPWDNPENIVTQEVSDDFGYGMQCVIFPILTIFGLTGNILSLIVLTRKKIRGSTTSIVLIGLAISDMCFLITNMCRKSTCIIGQFDELASKTWNAVSFRYIFYLRLVFSRISTLLIVLISLERFLAVAFPLKIRQLVTIPRMVTAVVACYVITFAGIAGIPPQYTYSYLRGTPVISSTDFAIDNAKALKIYNEYFLAIFYRYIPVAIVLLLNISIIFLLRKSKQFKKSVAKGSERSDEQRKITRMLLTVAIIYLICLIPGDAILIASDVDNKFRFFGNYHNLFLIVSDISLLFELVNSSINFIIYMVLNKNFYAVYVSLFCGCISRLRRRNKHGEQDIDSKEETRTKSKEKSYDTKQTMGEASSSQNDASYLGNQEGHANLAFQE